jgi:uncharacterized protein (TIGR02099 family)
VFLERMLRLVLWSTAAVVVLLALGLSAARMVLPGMSGYRAQLAVLAENYLQRPVSIGSLNASWRGFSPVLALNDVVISDARLPDGKLAVQEVQVALDLFDSLFSGTWRTAGIRVIGTRFELQTDIRRGERTFNLQAVLDWLLLQDSIRLDEVQLDWRDPGLFEVPLKLSGVSLQLLNQGRRHPFELSGALPSVFGDRIKLAADLSGKGSDPADWRGTLYVKTEALRLAAMQPALADTRLQAGGALDLEFWAGLQSARLAWGSASLDWQQPRLRKASADAPSLSAERLAGSLFWRYRQGRWLVGMDNFALSRDAQQVWPASRFELSLQPGETLRVHAGASLLVLEEVHALLPLLPWVDEAALALLERLQPQGLLRDANIEVVSRAGETPRVAVRAGIDKLRLAADGGMPGVTGLSGYVAGNLQAGYLQLDTHQAEFIAPRLFPQALPVSKLTGTLSWQRYTELLRLRSDDLRLESGSLALDGRMLLDWRNDQALPWVDVQLAAASLPLPDVPAVLPAVALPKVSAWLETALQAGTASNVRVLLQGRLDQLPFDDHQGRLEAHFDFEDARLDYSPDWGRLEQLSGHAEFTGRAMKITGQSGRILDSPLQRAVAVIEDLHKPVLDIDGSLGGTLAGMLGYVPTTPLNRNFGDMLARLDASGDAQLQLQLRIPLTQSPDPVTVSGDVRLAGNDLLFKQSDLSLVDLDGMLHFNEQGISVKRARAQLLERPVMVSVYGQGTAADAQTVVDIQGRLGLIERLRRQFPPLADQLDGSVNWQILIGVLDQARADIPRVRVRLSSDLQGASVRLPAPFGKTAEESRPFVLEWVPGEENRRPSSVQYGDEVHALALLGNNRQQLRRASVHVGEGEAALPSRDEILLTGRVPRLDLDAWLPVLRALDSGKDSGPELAVALRAEEVQFAGLGIGGEGVALSSAALDPWYFKIDGAGARGWLRWVQGGITTPPRLMMNMDRLYLQSLAAAGEAVAAAKPDSLDPAALPELDIKLGELRWGEHSLGEIGVHASRVPQGLNFDSLSMQSAVIQFDGNGEWLRRDGGDSTRFAATVVDGDLGRLAALLGTAGGIKGGKLSGAVRANWPGSPAGFSLASVEADVDIKASKGRLVEVNEGAGKLLNLFNLNSLQRRLSLDFSDVVKEGLSFDTLQGHLVLMDGNAYTKDFRIDGTGVKIDISGRTGLVQHDYDQLVTVTPQLASTLPLAGVIAGGPAVGAAVFLADKLVGDQLNKLTQVQYQVTGSWDDPLYTRLTEAEPEPRKPAPEDSERP